MPPERVVAVGKGLFSQGEWAALCRLRERYARDADLLNAAEKRRLDFFHWCYRVGALPSCD